MSRLLAAVAAALITATCASSAAAATGVVGHWPLNDGAGTLVADVSGTGNNGVLSGDASWSPGLSGSALSFGGASGQVQVADAPSLEPASAVTVSAWVRHAGSPGPYRYIVAKGARQCIAASYGLYTGANGGLQFYVSKNAGTTYTPSVDAGSGVWDGTWHLVAGTFDGSVLRVYVDGTEVGSSVSDPGPLVYGLRDANDLDIGSYPGCAGRSFIGLIDDVTIWNRALSPAEIGALVRAQADPASVPPSLGGSAGAGTGGAPGTSTSPGPASPAPSPAGAPALVHVRWSHASLLIRADGQLAGATGRTGLTITYDDRHASRVRLTLVRLVPGTRRRGRCVVPGRHAAHPCTRVVVVGSITRADRPGRTALRFTGLPGRRLTPGRYRLILTPFSGGRVGAQAIISFTVRRAG